MANFEWSVPLNLGILPFHVYLRLILPMLLTLFVYCLMCEIVYVLCHFLYLYLANDFYRAKQLCLRGLGYRNSVRLSV